MEFDLEHDYAYRTQPVTNDAGEPIGTGFYFEDEPLSVGRDVDGDLPTILFIEYADEIVGQELDHVIVKAVADDDAGGAERITRAVAFSPESTTEERVEFWQDLHPVF